MKGEHDGGYTVENSLPCPSSTNDRHPPLLPSPLARIPLHRALVVSFYRTRSLCRTPCWQDSRPTARRHPFPPLDTPPHKATHIQDDSNYVTTSRACDLLPPPAATRFLQPTLAPFVLHLLEVPIALYLRGPNSPASNPPTTPPSPRWAPTSGTVYTRYVARYISIPL